MTIALGLILFGILILLKNLEIIQGDMWRFVWPLVFIMVGASFIFKGTVKK